MTVELYRTLETPVRWKKTAPGFLLTAGLTNDVELSLLTNPTAAKVPIAAGTLTMQLLNIPSASGTIDKDFTPITVNLSGGSDSCHMLITLPSDFIRGYYKAHFTQKDINNNPTAVYEAWVAVDKTTDPKPDFYMDVESVRMQFADICELDNKMLDSLEVSVGDIGSAVERCLQQWDSVAPRTSSYTGYSFPYTELLRNGVMYMLLQSLIAFLSRNRMSYNAGGNSVDLESRVEAFSRLKQEYESYWRSGMAQIKGEENQMSWNGGLVYR